MVQVANDGSMFYPLPPYLVVLIHLFRLTCRPKDIKKINQSIILWSNDVCLLDNYHPTKSGPVGGYIQSLPLD